MDGKTKGLAFSNLLNGVPDYQVARDLKMSVEEVEAAFKFVRNKLKSYWFERRMPPVPCDTVAVAKRHRLELLNFLPDLNLEKPPAVRNIRDFKVDGSNLVSTFGVRA